MPGYGQNTDIDAAAEALAASTVVLTGVRIKALAANSGTIYLGNDSSVTASNGYPLAAGEECSFDVGWFSGNLANIYAIGSAANQAAAFWYV